MEKLKLITKNTTEIFKSNNKRELTNEEFNAFFEYLAKELENADANKCNCDWYLKDGIMTDTMEDNMWWIKYKEITEQNTKYREYIKSAI